MMDRIGPTREERAQAIDALLPALSGLIEVAADTAPSNRVIASAGQLAQQLREAAVVADALNIIAGGGTP
jgi:hypothetical protein